MKTDVAPSAPIRSEAPASFAKVAETVVDDATMLARLTEYLSAEAGDPVEIEAFARRSPGFSWLTYSFTARERSGRLHKLILRVGPTNGLFAPYSVLPQVYALQSMANSRVPVPRLVSYSQEGAQIGFPFFICEHVAGDVAAPWRGSDAPEELRRRVAMRFVDILAELHTADWEQLPLRGLLARVPPGERVERASLTEWRALVSRPLNRYYPSLDWAGRWLYDNCPTPPRTTIVHGDYRVGNFLEQNGEITAILDWELTHIGDPHEDLAWALVPTFNGGSRKLYGVMERSEALDRYQEKSGIALSPRSLAYYEAFAFYQMAAIQLCAVYAFEVTGFDDMRMAAMSTQMASIVLALDKAIEAAA